MSDTRLWYDKPALEWLSALPMGNGHMGAMAYGGQEGRFDLTENTCWAGQKDENNLPPDAKLHMQQAREALLKKEYAASVEHLKQCMGVKANYGTQVPMGRLFVSVEEECPQQTRELELITGVAKDELCIADRKVVRTSFISNPAKVMAVRLDAGGKLLGDVRVWIEGYSQPAKTDTRGDALTVNGRALEIIHSDGLHGVRYACELKIVTDGASHWERRGTIITGATQVTCYITAATDMFMPDYREVCQARLAAALDKGFDALYEEHVQEHSGWMNKCRLDMKIGSQVELPTDRRLAQYRQDRTDTGLVALMFQYGRYLILNSSRPDSLLPAALQGVWNDDRACRMEWTDDMHLDINTQMNYFPAEPTGLSECINPLFNWIKDVLKPQGEKIAQDLYGAPGWMAHTISNGFGYAAPGWGVEWGFFVNGGSWVSLHIWEHYLFTGDKEFLRAYWETFKGSAEYLLAVLEPDPETGKLLTVPGYSPENAFKWGDTRYFVTAGSTVDTALTKLTFDITLRCSEILGIQDDVTEKIKAALPLLPEFAIGKDGRLQEWFQDYEDALPDHRHTSHLLSLYPFNMLTLEEQPELMNAAYRSIQGRLGENAKDIVFYNWAGALLILYHARLRMGEEAGHFVQPMLAVLARENLMIAHEGDTRSIAGGIYELDGNTGFTTGVIEMLMQSYKPNEIHLLPAIPAQWAEGQFTGLRAYNGHQIDACWADGALTCAKITVGQAAQITVEYKGAKLTVACAEGESFAVTYDRAEGTLAKA